jgi:hypothetical protein
MHVAAGASRQQNVADDHDLFGLRRHSLEAESRADDAFVHCASGGQRRLFAMIRDGDVERARVLEGGAHEMRAGDGAAIITDRNGTGADHLTEFRERLPFLA